MTDYRTVEELFAKKIKLLRQLQQYELEKQKAITTPDIDEAMRLQDACGELYGQLQTLDKQMDALRPSIDVKTMRPAQRERLQKLEDLMIDAGNQAYEINLQNQQILNEIMDAGQRHLDKLQQGRKALAGYQTTMGPGKKPSRIFSGDI